MAKRKAETKKVAADITNKIHVSVVLDRSGSMDYTSARTIEGYNEYINALRADKAAEFTVTLIQFDSSGVTAGPTLTVCYEDLPLASVPALTPETYKPRGGTPLYDAIGECMRRTEAKDRAVVVLIITDGQENSSREFTREAIKAMVTEKEAAGWTFVFLGANIDSYAASSSLGMQSMNTASYFQGNEAETYRVTADATLRKSEAVRTFGIAGSNMTAFITDADRDAMMAPAQTVAGAGTFAAASPAIVVNQRPDGKQPNIVTLAGNGGQPAPATFPDRKPRKWTVEPPA